MRIVLRKRRPIIRNYSCYNAAYGIFLTLNYFIYLLYQLLL